MPETSLKEKTAKGLLWGGIGNGAMQLLNLVFGIFLARLLSTTDYGMVAVLTIFSATASIFAESGFVTAIVNKKQLKAKTIMQYSGSVSAWAPGSTCCYSYAHHL